MKKLLLPVLLASISLPLAAQELTTRDLAEATGLSQQQVRMVLGARSAYAEYRVRYNRVERQFKQALGEERFADLMAGKQIVLDDALRHRELASTAIGTKRTP